MAQIELLSLMWLTQLLEFSQQRINLIYKLQHLILTHDIHTAKKWYTLVPISSVTQPYHHIDLSSRQENGRKAWEVLRSYHKGEDYVNKTIQEYLIKVQTMYYQEETSRFNFGKLIDKQKEYYKYLQDVGYNDGTGVDNTSKCSNLKQGYRLKHN